MPRQELCSRLVALSPPRSATCLIYLYSYFERVGLQKVEGELHKRGEHPLDLEPVSAKQSLADLIRRLESITDPLEFNIFALRWLKRLDLRLAHQLPERLDGDPVPGDDGVLYVLRRRNDGLAMALGDVAWEADQSRSVAAYCRHHKLVPSEKVKGVEIECLSPDEWGNPHLHRRLKRLLSRHNPQRAPPLRVLHWPFLNQLNYDVEHWPRNGQSEKRVQYVSLRGIHNEDELLEDIVNALSEARRLEAAILIFPELVMTAEADARIREVLAKQHGMDGFPILTLYGCCHRRCDDGRADVNDAFLLGPDGSEICRHRKLTNYTAGRQIAEKLEPGERLIVLECGLGNLLPLICLDLPNLTMADLISSSHANVLLVASLSPKTSTHARLAGVLQGSNRASVFVCNRRFKDPQPCSDDPAGSSFYRAGRSEVFHFSRQNDEVELTGKPYLLFSGLDDSTTDQVK